MTDALSLLRNFVKIKKDFQEEDDKIIFGDVYYPKNVKTTYLIYGLADLNSPSFLKHSNITLPYLALAKMADPKNTTL